MCALQMHLSYFSEHMISCLPLDVCVAHIPLTAILCQFRYGWTTNMSIIILRHTTHENCAKNMTGFISLIANADEKYDAFCYDKTGNNIHRKWTVVKIV